MPSALNEPREAILWCDDHGFRFNQIAEMTTREGGEARTIKMCKLCHNGRLVKQGKQPLKVAEWQEIVERKAHSGRLWKIIWK